MTPRLDRSEPMKFWDKKHQCWVELTPDQWARRIVKELNEGHQLRQIAKRATAGLTRPVLDTRSLEEPPWEGSGLPSLCSEIGAGDAVGNGARRVDLGRVVFEAPIKAEKTYYSSVSYSLYMPWEKIDAKKWPNTFRFLVRFYHHDSYHKETKYVSDYDKTEHKYPGSHAYGTPGWKGHNGYGPI